MNARQATGMCNAVERAEAALGELLDREPRREILWALADAAFALGAMHGIDRALVTMAKESGNEHGRQA